MRKTERETKRLKEIHAEADKVKLVNAINLLLCHCEQTDMKDTAVGLKMALERLGLEDYCVIWVDTKTKTQGGYKLRLLWIGDK